MPINVLFLLTRKGEFPQFWVQFFDQSDCLQNLFIQIEYRNGKQEKLEERIEVPASEKNNDQM